EDREGLLVSGQANAAVEQVAGIQDIQERFVAFDKLCRGLAAVGRTDLALSARLMKLVHGFGPPNARAAAVARAASAIAVLDSHANAIALLRSTVDAMNAAPQPAMRSTLLAPLLRSQLEMDEAGARVTLELATTALAKLTDEQRLNGSMGVAKWLVAAGWDKEAHSVFAAGAEFVADLAKPDPQLSARLKIATRAIELGLSRAAQTLLAGAVELASLLEKPDHRVGALLRIADMQQEADDEAGRRATLAQAATLAQRMTDAKVRVAALLTVAKKQERADAPRTLAAATPFANEITPIQDRFATLLQVAKAQVRADDRVGARQTLQRAELAFNGMDELKRSDTRAGYALAWAAAGDASHAIAYGTKTNLGDDTRSFWKQVVQRAVDSGDVAGAVKAANRMRFEVQELDDRLDPFKKAVERHVKKGQFVRALELVKTIADVKGTFHSSGNRYHRIPLLLLISDAQSEVGRRDDARRTLALALAFVRKGDGLWRKISQWCTVAERQHRAGLTREASKTLALLLEHIDTGMARPTQADAYRRAAFTLLATGAATARQCLDKAVAALPDAKPESETAKLRELVAMLYGVAGDIQRGDALLTTDEARFSVCRRCAENNRHDLAREWALRITDEELRLKTLYVVARLQAHAGHGTEVAATVRTFPQVHVANIANAIATETLKSKRILAENKTKVVEALLPVMADLPRAVQYSALAAHLAAAGDFDSARRYLTLLDDAHVEHENAPFFKTTAHASVAAWHADRGTRGWTLASRRAHKQLVRTLAERVRALKAATDAKRVELVALWTHVAEYAKPIRDRESADLAYYQSRLTLAAIQDAELKKKAGGHARTVAKSRIEAGAAPGK
ncbi:MAG: hypothetical protein OER88_05830, partial [Planctomycetota bacterium]|nr:hypothetical protein [Planctomycetota bacterium]